VTVKVKPVAQVFDPATGLTNCAALHVWRAPSDVVLVPHWHGLLIPLLHSQSTTTAAVAVTVAAVVAAAVVAAVVGAVVVAHDGEQHHRLNQVSVLGCAKVVPASRRRQRMMSTVSDETKTRRGVVQRVTWRHSTHGASSMPVHEWGMLPGAPSRVVGATVWKRHSVTQCYHGRC